jgi:aerobic-type carbon monoxide dehydrogenase small subunit (CoxS/CutS family)
MKLEINGAVRDVDAPPDMPLLWVLRDLVDDDIDAAMSGNICRCGTYQRVREAIHLAARLKRGGK